MDQSQGSSRVLANLPTLPTELLVYIISFLSSTRDRVKLRYVSRWLRCVTEGTPSLWKEFMWPYYDSREECSVNEVLKMCGQHIKVLSFPYSKVPPSLVVEMLQYCSNVEHLSLPSTSLYPEDLKEPMDHLRHLQTLELELEEYDDFKELLLSTGQLKELTIIPNICDDYHGDGRLKYFDPRETCMKWEECAFRPSTLGFIGIGIGVSDLEDCATQLTNIPNGTTAIFKAYDKDHNVPFSPLFPCFQLQIEASGQVTTPCVELSDFSVLGLENDLVEMTDCQYDGRTLHMAKYYQNQFVLDTIVKPCDLSCVTDFDLSDCKSLYSGHLEQIAIACPNLQRLNLDHCRDCLSSLQGLQAIASHCPHLEGLDIVCVNIEDHILLWKILSGMKLIKLRTNFCVFTSKADCKILINLYQKCWSIQRIRFSNCYKCKFSADEDVSILSYFPSLHYCYFEDVKNPHLVQDMINNCKELKYFSYLCNLEYFKLSLSLAHNRNLQQLYIEISRTDVPDEFMTSVSAHGGLVHVFMTVRSLTAEGITSLVRNSPKLITLYLNPKRFSGKKSFNATLKTAFRKRKLFTADRYVLVDKSTYDFSNLEFMLQGRHLLPL